MFKRYVLLAHEARTLKKRKILRFCAESHPNPPKKNQWFDTFENVFALTAITTPLMQAVKLLSFG